MVGEEPSTSGLGQAWRLPGRAVGAVVLGGILVLGLSALIGAIDPAGLAGPSRPDVVGDPGRSGSGSAAGAGAAAGTPSTPGPIRLITADGSTLDIQPIAGCDGGLSINGEILILPDPEACGYRPLGPGEVRIDDDHTILVPDRHGEIAGVRFDEDGRLTPVDVDELDAESLRFHRRADGSMTLEGAADGEPIEIEWGDGELVVTDPDGTRYLVTGGEELAISLDPDEPAPDAPNRPARRVERPSDPGPGVEALAAILVIVIMVTLVAAVAMLIKGLSGWRPRLAKGQDIAPPDVGEAAAMLVERPDFSNEIDAIDRMLWEIEQEPDPRKAIQKVYAAVETGLGNAELARRREETPGVYLRRVLGRIDGLDGPLAELTVLFEQARFSEHEITQHMRERAIGALQAIRARFHEAATESVDPNELQDTVSR